MVLKLYRHFFFQFYSVHSLQLQAQHTLNIATESIPIVKQYFERTILVFLFSEYVEIILFCIATLTEGAYLFGSVVPIS